MWAYPRSRVSRGIPLMHSDLARELLPLINTREFEKAINAYVAWRKIERQRLAVLGREVYSLGEHNGAVTELNALGCIIDTVKNALR